MEVEMPLHRRVAAARNCECCGTRTDRYEPRTGLPWHEGCRMPAWIARHHKRRGLKIPSALVAEPAEVVDRYGDDWRQPFQRQAVAA